MALIRTIASSTAGNRGRVHGDVECGYTVFEQAGRRYLQLDTYGSSRRVIPGKVSQTLQFDEDGARRLKRLIEQTFPSI